MRPSVKITLREDERSELERLARGRKVWRGLSDRAHIVLLVAEGLTNVQIGTVLGVTDQTARKWRNRFAGASYGRARRRAALGPSPAHR